MAKQPSDIQTPEDVAALLTRLASRHSQYDAEIERLRTAFQTFIERVEYEIEPPRRAAVQAWLDEARAALSPTERPGAAEGRANG